MSSVCSSLLNSRILCLAISLNLHGIPLCRPTLITTDRWTAKLLSFVLCGIGKFPLRQVSASAFTAYRCRARRTAQQSSHVEGFLLCDKAPSRNTLWCTRLVYLSTAKNKSLSHDHSHTARESYGHCVAAEYSCAELQHLLRFNILFFSHLRRSLKCNIQQASTANARHDTGENDSDYNN